MTFSILILSHRKDLLLRQDATASDITPKGVTVKWYVNYNGTEPITQSELRHFKLFITDPKDARNDNGLLLLKMRLDMLQYPGVPESDYVMFNDDDADFNEGYLNDIDIMVEMFQRYPKLNCLLGLMPQFASRYYPEIPQYDIHIINDYILSNLPGTGSGIILRNKDLDFSLLPLTFAGGGEDSAILLVMLIRCGFVAGMYLPHIYHISYNDRYLKSDARAMMEHSMLFLRPANDKHTHLFEELVSMYNRRRKEYFLC